MLRSSLLLLFLLLTVPSILAAIIHHPIHIRLTSLSPTCESPYPVVTANGSLPGPAIHAYAGDTLSLMIHNHLPQDSFAMHFHGISQRDTPWMDGVPWITQRPIPPRQSRLYAFKVDTPGTYFYHAHSKFHAFSVYGAILVHSQHEHTTLHAIHGVDYDEDRVVVLGDAFQYPDRFIHRVSEQDQVLPHTSIPVPSAILINGAAVNPLAKQGCQRAPRIVLAPGKTHRIRVIHAGGKSAYRIALPPLLNPRIIEADGTLTRPHTIDPDSGLDIDAGQRYSILMDMPSLAQSSPKDIFPVFVALDHASQDHHTHPVLSLLVITIRDDKDDGSSTRHTFNTYELDRHDPMRDALDGFYPVLHHARATVLTSTTRVADSLVPAMPTQHYPPEIASHRLFMEINSSQDFTHYTINQNRFVPPAGYDPLLLRLAHRHPDTVLHRANVFSVPMNATVDIILQYAAGFCRKPHPWHLHGHSMFLMGTGPGRFHGKIPRQGGPHSHILARDTISGWSHTEKSSQDGCGWWVLRFKADNPGIWHCTFFFSGSILRLTFFSSLSFA